MARLFLILLCLAPLQADASWLRRVATLLNGADRMQTQQFAASPEWREKNDIIGHDVVSIERVNTYFDMLQVVEYQMDEAPEPYRTAYQLYSVGAGILAQLNNCGITEDMKPVYGVGYTWLY